MMSVETVIKVGADAPGVFGSAVEVRGSGVDGGEIESGQGMTAAAAEGFEWWDRDGFEESAGGGVIGGGGGVGDGEARREEREFEEENEEEVEKGEGGEKLQRSPCPLSHPINNKEERKTTEEEDD